MEKNIVVTVPSSTITDVTDIILNLANGMDVSIQVKKNLSMSEKIKVIEKIINTSISTQFNYFNPLFLNIVAKIEVIDAYTNIICQTNDLYEFYDNLKINGIFDAILPLTEYEEIYTWSKECAESLCKYKNSFIGTLQGMNASKETEEMVAQLTELAQSVKEDTDIKQFMEEVAPHLV